MRRRLGNFSAMVLLAAAACGGQCVARMTPIPTSGKHLPVPDGAYLMPGMFVHYRHSLGDGKAIFVYGRQIDLPDPGYSDEGLLFATHGKVIQKLPLSNLKALRGSDDFERNHFLALSLTQACSEGTPLYFLAFGYMGDMTSPDMFISLTPQEDRFLASSLPLVNGGVLDLSRSEPLRVRTWTNLFEGECNACETHYEISEFTLVDGRPRRVRRFLTRK